MYTRTLREDKMTESTIDTDRMMQGIDCEVITWTKCSERMPPNTKCKIIVRGSNVKDPHYYFGSFLNSAISEQDAVNWEWTPYTKKTWAELNKCNQK